MVNQFLTWFKNNNVFFTTNKGILLQEDCTNVLKNIPSKSIKLIYCDLPFGKTQNSWDNIIPSSWMWDEFNRVLKNDGCVVLHSMEEFTFLLGISNLKYYRYKWYWQKDRGTGFLNAKKMPLRNIEDILVFSPSKLGNFTYNPQMTIGAECHSRGKAIGKKQGNFSTNDNYGELKAVKTKGNLKYPKTLLKFSRDKEKLHPTQKPLALAEYIIKTYTNEKDTVLDISSGVSTSGLASEINNRYWINIEKDVKKDKKTKDMICAGYCQKAKDRINMYLNNKMK